MISAGYADMFQQKREQNPQQVADLVVPHLALTLQKRDSKPVPHDKPQKLHPVDQSDSNVDDDDAERMRYVLFQML